MAQIGAERPLVVTDAGIAAHPMAATLRAALEDAGLPSPLFSAVKSNPTGANVADGATAFRERDCDAVIALGGGSALDAAKAVALIARQDRPLWDFEDLDDNWTRADAGAVAPVIALPTTAGTGSELGRSSVITDEAAGRKVVIFHPRMLPALVIMDPDLTVGLPPGLTAATGMDALSHALEAYCAPSRHPMAEGLALQALAMIAPALPRAVADGADRAARADILIASGMACVALQKGLGGMHALSHALGPAYDAHHGRLNAVLMPHVLRVNWAAIEDKMARLSHHLHLGGEAEAVLDWIEDLRREIGIPDRLSGMGVVVAAGDLDRRADAAAADLCAAGNPTPFGAAAARAVLERAA